MPPGLASGDYLLQAAGQAITGAIRTVTLTVRVEVSPSILVNGTRAEVRGRPGVQVTGVTTGLEASLVTPRFRMAKSEAYVDGVGIRTVGDDGSFTWERITKQWIYVYFVAEGVRSNRLVFR